MATPPIDPKNAWPQKKDGFEDVYQKVNLDEIDTSKLEISATMDAENTSLLKKKTPWWSNAIPEIQDINAYIAATKEAAKDKPQQLQAMDGSDLTKLPNAYAVVPHQKGDHKVVFLRGNAPQDILPDPKNRIKWSVYQKDGEAIYDVHVDMYQHPTLRTTDGKPLDVRVIDSGADLDQQIQSLYNGKWGGTNFWLPVVLWSTPSIPEQKPISDSQDSSTDHLPSPPSVTQKRTSPKESSTDTKNIKKDTTSTPLDQSKEPVASPTKKDAPSSKSKSDSARENMKAKLKEAKNETTKKTENETTNEPKNTSDSKQSDTKKTAVETIAPSSDKIPQKKVATSKPATTSQASSWWVATTSPKKQSVSETSSQVETQLPPSEQSVSQEKDLITPPVKSQTLWANEVTQSVATTTTPSDVPTNTDQVNTQNTSTNQTAPTQPSTTPSAEDDSVSSTSPYPVFSLNAKKESTPPTSAQKEVVPATQAPATSSAPTASDIPSENIQPTKVVWVNKTEWISQETISSSPVTKKPENQTIVSEVLPSQEVKKNTAPTIEQILEQQPKNSWYIQELLERKDVTSKETNLPKSTPTKQRKPLLPLSKKKKIGILIVLLLLTIGILSIMFGGWGWSSTPSPEDTTTTGDMVGSTENPDGENPDNEEDPTLPTDNPDPDSDEEEPTLPTDDPEQSSSFTMAELVAKLEDQQVEARTTLNQARQVGNREAIKFSVAALQKATSTLERIENDTTYTADQVQRDATRVDTYLKEAQDMLATNE